MESTADTNPLDGLSLKHRKFVEEYLDCLNASEAYRRAGYSANAANASGPRLLANVSISAAVSFLGEQLGMPVGEAVRRMTNWGRGSLEPFIDEDGEINVLSDEAKAKIGLVKRYKRRKEIRTTDKGEKIETITTEIELHDAKDAVDKILQLHGRYKQVPGDLGNEAPKAVYELPDGTKLHF